MSNNPAKRAAAAFLILGSIAAIIAASLYGVFSLAGINLFKEALIPKSTPTVSDQLNGAKRNDDDNFLSPTEQPTGDPTASRTASPFSGPTATPTQRNHGFGTTQSNCSSIELNDTISSPPPLPGKKGIGMTLYPENWQLHLDLIKMLNVSWNYSWDATRIAAQPNDIEFVPMIWGRYNVLEQLIGDIIPEFKAKRIHRFLTFNEPDNEKQSNVAVKRVVDEFWPVLENARIPMSSPAATHPLGNWSREFCKHAEASCLRMEYTALHWYGDTNVTNFKKNMIEAYELYGRRPILLTEFAVADWDSTTPEENRVLDFMKIVIPWLEHQDFVAGYSWFDFDPTSGPGGVSSLFHGRASKNMTALGRFYASVTTQNPMGDQSIKIDDDTR